MTTTRPYRDPQKPGFCVTAVKDHQVQTFNYPTVNQAIVAFQALVEQGYRVR